MEAIPDSIYRISKKNHDAMVRINKQFTDTLGKQGPLHIEFFCLSSNESLMPFTNIAKTISANQDDEVWMEIHSYKDRKLADDVERARGFYSTLFGWRIEKIEVRKEGIQ